MCGRRPLRFLESIPLLKSNPFLPIVGSNQRIIAWAIKKNVCSIPLLESNFVPVHYCVQRAACSVQRAVYSVQCVVCSVQCAVCSVQCAVYSVQRAVCSVQCEVKRVQCAVCSVQRAPYSVQCAVCSVQCAVCSAHPFHPRIQVLFAGVWVRVRGLALKKNVRPKAASLS